MTMAGVPERFQRQLGVHGFGPDAQRRLGSATAFVAGVGGVGGTAALYLAAAGIGRLVLCHPGVAEPPDLNRQVLVRADQLGEPRVSSARATISHRYPDVAIVAVDEPIWGPSVASWLEESDVALDCRHNFAERLELNRLCVRAALPLVEVAMDGAWGYVTVIRPPQTPCLQCLVGDGDPAWQPLGFPVIGVAAGAVGCLAAAEGIKAVTGWGDPLEGSLLTIDLGDMTSSKVTLARNDVCGLCSAPDARRAG